MGVIVMDHAVVEKGCIVAVKAVVLENFRCESGYIYAGIPAKAIKKVSPEQLLSMQQTALRYIDYASWMKLDS